MPKKQSNPIPIRLDSDHAALSIARTSIEKEMRRCETAWRDGSIPALVDALIRCHETREPIPLWLVQGSIELIKMLFIGKSLAKRGRTGKPAARSKADLTDYARWDAVKEFTERQTEILAFLDHPSFRDQRKNRPQLFALGQDKTLDQRCAAVSELFNLSNDPAKGRPDTILRSYKKVEREMKNGRVAPYYLPRLKNPLHPTIA